MRPARNLSVKRARAARSLENALIILRATKEEPISDQWFADVERLEKAVKARRDYLLTLSFGSPERARRFFGWAEAWSALLPPRIANEVFGDYMEDLCRRAEKGQRKLLYLRMLAAMFWTGVNTVGYWRKQLGSKKSA